MAVNCSAFPEELLESELFGYEPGAFSGAKRDGKRGFIEEADQGTLFLDEVADLSPAGQAKLCDQLLAPLFLMLLAVALLEPAQETPSANLSPEEMQDDQFGP